MCFNCHKSRLRFAPSPTGFLHFGNLRAALFGYLLAKSQKGKYLLRVEDTDQKREVPGAIDNLIKVLQSLNIKFDEGPHCGGKYGPYIQSQRLDIYKKYADELIAKGKAYHCFCSEERLEKMRREQEAQQMPPRYDRCCRALSSEEINHKIQAGEKFVIRQKMPLEGEIKVFDELRGEIIFPAKDLDDHVLIKSNGVPTYQFANVIDDHLMKITQVTRAAEWLPSFPKNILLYQSFGWIPPQFIHLPLILNKEGGGKLSKRKGDVFVEDYLTKGYLPEAMINFAVLLGWHSKDDKEIYSLKELEKVFNIKGIGASPAIFDLDKLDFFNGYYIRQKSIKELGALCRHYLEKAGHNLDNQQLEKFISLSQDRLKKLSDIVEITNFLFELPNYEPSLIQWKTQTIEEAKNNLIELKSELEKIPEKNWTKENLEKTILSWLKSTNRKNGDYLWPLRVALTGLQNSPGPFEVAWALDKTETLNRINLTLQ